MAGLVDFTKEEEVEEYLTNIEIEYMFGCRKEHNEDSCYRLGEFLDSMRRQFVEAAEIYKMCCEKWQNAPCCYKTGNYHMLGRGRLEKSSLKAYEFYKIACDQNLYPDQGKNDRIAAGCVSKASLLQNNEDVRAMFLKEGDVSGKENRDYSRKSQINLEILKSYEKACNLNDSIGCNLLSLLYLNGFPDDPKTKNLKLAAKYADKSCQFGEMQACHNLSLMYKRGDGVEKDMGKSNEYAKLRDQMLSGNDTLKFGES